MSKIILVVVLLLQSSIILAQSSTEVYLFDLSKKETTFELTNPVNISDNEGYDNQPSFLIDGSGVFLSSTRNGQTDIALYSISDKKLNYLNNTPSLSEYSPIQTPDKVGISFIILSEDGTQQFWKINPSKPEPTILESELVIGYYVWYTNDIYFCFVLPSENSPSTLQMHTLEKGEKEILGNNPGRSLHNIPKKKAISFIDKNGSSWKIKAYYPETKTFKDLVNTLPDVEDMVWIDTNTIIMGKGSKLYFYDLREEVGKKWELISDLSEFGLDGITRLAYQDGKLAIVVNGK